MKYLIAYKIFENQEEISIEEIIKKASKYKSLHELKKRDMKLYLLIKNHNLEKTIFPRASKWTEEKIREEAKKYSKRSDFFEKSEGAYIRAKGLNMLDELFPKKKSD
jgi:hypothetical protein